MSIDITALPFFICRTELVRIKCNGIRVRIKGACSGIVWLKVDIQIPNNSRNYSHGYDYKHYHPHVELLRENNRQSGASNGSPRQQKNPPFGGRSGKSRPLSWTHLDYSSFPREPKATVPFGENALSIAPASAALSVAAGTSTTGAVSGTRDIADQREWRTAVDQICRIEIGTRS